MSIYEIDTGGVERIRGTLHTTGGAPGDVPVQQADGQLLQAPGGGSTPVQANYEGNVVTIADGGNTVLTWDTLEDGTELLDRNDPAFPVFLAAGTYAVWIQVSLAASPSGITAGGSASVAVGSTTLELPTQVMPGGSQAVQAQLAVTVSFTNIFAEGDSLAVFVANDDGADAHDFKIAYASIVKLA